MANPNQRFEPVKEYVPPVLRKLTPLEEHLANHSKEQFSLVKTVNPRESATLWKHIDRLDHTSISVGGGSRIRVADHLYLNHEVKKICDSLSDGLRSADFVSVSLFVVNESDWEAPVKFIAASTVSPFRDSEVCPDPKRIDPALRPSENFYRYVNKHPNSVTKIILGAWLPGAHAMHNAQQLINDVLYGVDRYDWENWQIPETTFQEVSALTCQTD